MDETFWRKELSTLEEDLEEKWKLLTNVTRIEGYLKIKLV
jgi:hypothetical protein